jgi:hypothetical protein
MLFISNKTWQAIRGQFSEDERTTLRSVIIQQVLGPVAGWDLNVDKLDAGLEDKVVTAVMSRNPAVRR